MFCIEDAVQYIAYLTPRPPCAVYVRRWIMWELVQIMACRVFNAKPLSKPKQGYYQLNP